MKIRRRRKRPTELVPVVFCDKCRRAIMPNEPAGHDVRINGISVYEHRHYEWLCSKCLRHVAA